MRIVLRLIGASIACYRSETDTGAAGVPTGYGLNLRDVAQSGFLACCGVCVRADCTSQRKDSIQLATDTSPRMLRNPRGRLLEKRSMGVFEASREFTNVLHAVPPHAAPLVPGAPEAPGYWPVPPAPPAPPGPPLPRFQARVQVVRLHVPSPPPKPEPPGPPAPPEPP